MADQLSLRCDKTSFFGVCMLIYFLPISSALLEWSFAFIFVPYLVKRSVIFFRSLGVKSGNSIFNLFSAAYKPAPSFLNKKIAIFLLSVFISVLFSVDLQGSLKSYLFDLLQGTFTFFICCEVVNTQKRLRTILIIFGVSIAVITLNGMAQRFFTEGFIFHQSQLDGRMISTFPHSNDFAAYLLTILPVTLSMSFLYNRKVLNAQGKLGPFLDNHMIKVYFTVLFIFTWMCLGFTFSRGGWLALLLSLALYSFINKNRFATFLLIGVFFVAVFYPQMKTVRNVSFLSDDAQKSMSPLTKKNFTDQLSAFGGMGRKTYWREGVEVFKKRPVFGVGLDAYRRAGELYVDQWSGYHAHNCFLQMLAEIGIVGCSIFTWIILSLLMQIIKVVRINLYDPYSIILSGLIVGLFGFLVHSFFDTSFYSTKLQSFFWLIAGLLAAIHQNFIVLDQK